MASYGYELRGRAVREIGVQVILILGSLVGAVMTAIAWALGDGLVTAAIGVGFFGPLAVLALMFWAGGSFRWRRRVRPRFVVSSWPHRPRSLRRSRPLRLRLRIQNLGGADLRCAYCHDDSGCEALKACPGCRTRCHADCLIEAGACPTLGCAGRALALKRRVSG